METKEPVAAKSSEGSVFYRKTASGEWVAYGPDDVVKAGCKITVLKKNGIKKIETILSVTPAKPDGFVYGQLKRGGFIASVIPVGRCRGCLRTGNHGDPLRTYRTCSGRTYQLCRICDGLFTDYYWDA